MLRSLLQSFKFIPKPSKRIRQRNHLAARSYARRGFVQQFEQLEARLPFHTDADCGGSGHDLEHRAMMSLVDLHAVTHRAVASGDWDDAATWENGQIPGTGARVHVPVHKTVTVDSVETSRLMTVRVDGELEFAPNVSTRLTLDTMVITSCGTLQIGTAAEPIADSVTAELVIAADQPIDTQWDPLQLSRGLISHGKLDMYGSATTPFVKLAGQPIKGTKQFVLATMPQGWESGEQLVLTGDRTMGGAIHTDERFNLSTLEIVNGIPTLTASNSLKRAYGTNDLYLANLTRNVRIRSESVADVQHRGHVMIMHHPDAHIEYAGFYGLGRTNKAIPLNNAVLDDQNQVSIVGKNQTGRYAVHVHRSGLQVGAEAVVIRGSVVAGTAVVGDSSRFVSESTTSGKPEFLGSPGWGIVNHSSHVQIEGNTVYEVTGASFAAEAGNEIGTFAGNLALRTRGSGGNFRSRQLLQDFGHEGTGFWFQGAGTAVRDNVAAGHRSFGYAYFTEPLLELVSKPTGTEGRFEHVLQPVFFDAHNLVDPSWAKGKSTLAVGAVPIRQFSNNTVFATGSTMLMWTHMFNTRHNARSTIEGLRSWMTINGMMMQYTRDVTLRNVSIQAQKLDATSNRLGININVGVADIIYDNVTIRDFNIGIELPRKGQNQVLGGYFDNLTNFIAYTSVEDNRTIEINLETSDLGPRTQKLLKLQEILDFRDPDITPWFADDQILLKLDGDTKQVYFPSQTASYVPFVTGQTEVFIPEFLKDKTNQQLMDQYGFSLGGAITPDDAEEHPLVSNGRVGSSSTHLPDILTKRFVNVSSINLRYRVDLGKYITESTPTTLAQGWNVLVRQIGGRDRGILVYSDTTPPTVDLSNVVKQYKRSDLHKPLYVTAPIIDDGMHILTFKKNFDLRKYLITRADGTQIARLPITIKDFSLNTATVFLEIVILP